MNTSMWLQSREKGVFSSVKQTAEVHSYYSLRIRPVLHHGMVFANAGKALEGMCMGVNDLSFRLHGDLIIVVGQDYCCLTVKRLRSSH